MAGLGDLVQKAFYLGIGAASYAGEKAGETLKDLREQSQSLVAELVDRGEITAEEAQQLLSRMMRRVQESVPRKVDSPSEEPRRIEILDEEEEVGSPSAQEAEALRKQVEALRQQLEALKRKNGQ